MEFDEINKYLSKLEGPALIEKFQIDEAGNISNLMLRFQGTTGTIDIGEVEIAFFGVEIVNIPQGFMTPVRIRPASKSEADSMIETNYSDHSATLYLIEDCVDVTWFVYAESYTATILPIFYGEKYV